MQQLLGWIGEPVRIRLRMDAAAARSVLCRQGVGRIRHLEVKVLWVQDQVKNGRVLVEKVEGIWNQADLGTRPLDEKTLVRHRGSLGLKTLPEKLTEAAIAAVGSGWFRQCAKARMLPLMLAAVPLAAGADDRGLCLATTSSQPVAAGGGVGWQMVLWLGCRLHSWWYPRPAQGSVKTRSKTRYAERFVLVPERDQGAFLDINGVEVQSREVNLRGERLTPLTGMMQGRRDL